MGKKSIEILVGLFVLLGMVGLVFLALKAANLGTFSSGDTYTLTANFDNIGGAQGARAGAQRRRHGRPGRLDHARPEDVPGRGAARRSSAACSSRTTRRRSILTSGLLGDQYVGVEPGASDKNVGRRRHDQADTIGGRAREPDQPVPVQQGRRRRQHAPHAAASAARRSEEMKRPVPRAAPTPGGARSSWRSAGCHDDPRRRAAAPASVSTRGRTGTARSSTSTRTSTAHVLKPVATVYSDVIPQPVRRGVSNFFGNFARRLVGGQQHAAGQDRGRLRGRDAGR